MTNYRDDPTTVALRFILRLKLQLIQLSNVKILSLNSILAIVTHKSRNRGIVMSFNPKPSYHLCPSFMIPPPPDGHLDLGSILTNLDSDGVDNPLNIYSRISVPEEQIYPRNKPDEKHGFTRTLKELRSVEAGIWAKICGFGSVGARFLRERSDDETLTVVKLLTRYFSPSKEYMDESLGDANVTTYVEDTQKKQPLYMVTGYMYVEGAKLSRADTKSTEVGGEASATDPATQSSMGGKAGYKDSSSSGAGFNGSTSFILGLRVRKIWWKKDGERQMSDKVAGATLEDSAPAKDKVLNGLQFEDDATLEGEKVDMTTEVLGIEPSVWVLKPGS